MKLKKIGCIVLIISFILSTSSLAASKSDVIENKPYLVAVVETGWTTVTISGSLSETYNTYAGASYTNQFTSRTQSLSMKHTRPFDIDFTGIIFPIEHELPTVGQKTVFTMTNVPFIVSGDWQWFTMRQNADVKLYTKNTEEISSFGFMFDAEQCLNPISETLSVELAEE